MNQIWLTIDDGPSTRAEDLLKFLRSKRFGALLFCRGDYLRAKIEWGVRAIKEGYIIGNHSYDHPHFSTLTHEQVREQIAKTDAIIDQIYVEAAVRRPQKYFRFPYGDAGANDEIVETNQQLLGQYGYSSPIHLPRRDWGWDVQVMDWGVETSNVAQKLEFARKQLSLLQLGDVLDLHDKTVNFELGLTQNICQTVLELGFNFYNNRNFQEQTACR
jgi:peptidoglycan/xylan/chitin deacetylase (PgdA/CDA1 family)